MKILIVFLGIFTRQFKDGRLNYGISGGTRHWVEVFKRGGSMVHNIHVLTTKTGACVLRANNLDADFHTLDDFYENWLSKSFIGLSLSYISLALKACVLMSQNNFDAICSASHFIYNVFPAVVISKRNPHSKILVYLHHLTPSPIRRGLYNPLLPNVLGWLSQLPSLPLIKKCAHLTFSYPQVRKQLIELGFSEEKTKIMYNGIDFGRLRKVKKSKEAYSAAFLGAMSCYKGIFDLVSIWKDVCKEMPYVKMVVMGEGKSSVRNDWMKKVRNTELSSNISYLGYAHGDVKYAILKSSKVFLYPSYEEGWAIAICEAMACGLPVVTYDLPAYKAIYQQGIRTVPIGDRKALAKEIIKLLKDSELRKKLRNEAIEQASKYRWNSVASTELSILEGLKFCTRARVDN